MNSKHLLATFVTIAFLTIYGCANASATSDDLSNYHRACEALYEDRDIDAALKYVNAQLDKTPHNADALYLRARIYWNNDNNSDALKDLQNSLKYHNAKCEVYKSTVYVLRGRIYQEIEQYDEAVECFRMAVKYVKKDNPDRYDKVQFEYGEALYQADRYNESTSVFQDMLSRFKENTAAMVGISRNYLAIERYQEGLDILDKAQKIDSDYSQIFRFKMQILDKLGRYDEAADAAIKYLELDEDAPLNRVATIVEKHYTYGVAKTKEMLANNPDDINWIFLLARLYENHGDYANKIPLIEGLMKENGEHEVLYKNIAECYAALGDLKKALQNIDKAVEMSDDIEIYGQRADILRSFGQYDKAIEDYTKIQEKNPANGYYYYAIGWCHELKGDKETALEIYNEGVDLDNTHAYLLLSRADLLKEKGDTEGAIADYEKILDLDTEAEDGSCRQYALAGLGRNDEAMEWMEKIIADNPYDSGRYYDKACLLCRMGRIDEAIAALEESFKHGFRRFAHLEHDDDMDPIRDLSEYKELVNRYRQMDPAAVMEEASSFEASRDVKISEVSVKKMAGGTYEVPCSVNGLPLKFIFDTGASDVTISSVEANFMLKNDYLSQKDFRGKKQYLTASGEITEGTVVCIKEIMLGDAVLKNVNASVVKNQKAPLLLGQTVLERLGSFTFDNDSQKLIIRY